MVLNDKEFFSETALGLILNTFGWDYSNHLGELCKEKNFNDNVPFKADFYPLGSKLAYSKRAIIVCDGIGTIIKYKDKRYTSPWEIYSDWGISGFEDIEQWKYEEEKEWLIRKINGDWVQTFTHLNKCPFRTTIRC
tara:strand:- start:212 stop:619 length:408 start_codon:yes stop_codon:yes gene_type:complete